MFDLFKIKYGFPNKVLSVPIGWEDRGVMNFVYKKDDKTTYKEIHTYCGSTLHVGIENEIAFKFCPMCFIKMKEETNEN